MLLRFCYLILHAFSMHASIAGKAILLIVVSSLFSNVSAQRKISFVAADKLVVTADLYLYDTGAPYILLFHQESGSRGEYKEIAPKLSKMGFNCLAVDLRNGKECNFVQNETAVQAAQNNIPATFLDCEKDIAAAIDYVAKTAIKNKCILFGSSFSASLAMQTANRNNRVTAVIAFSPGEYFAPALMIKDKIADFDKLLFAASTKREYSFMKDLVKEIPQQNITTFQPSSGDGVHGAPALWNSNSSSGEYWMSLMMFVKKVKETKYK